MLEPLKTRNGSKIWYSKFGVGKRVGGKIYVHKYYATDIVPSDVWEVALSILNKYEPKAPFNCICYDINNPSVIRFDEAPYFNTDREPFPGIMWTVDTSMIDEGEKCYRVGYSDAIWHHKWLWVRDDYKDFDVQESWEWSKLWLSKVNEVASGSFFKWKEQLQSVGLK